jgi:O-antigen/teichoic acid export membrane protein
VLGIIRNRPILANTFGTLVVRGSTTGTRLIATFIIAQAITPSVFGVIAFVLAMTEIAKSIADLGVDTFTLRHLAITSERNAQKQFLGIVAFTKLISGVVTYSIFIGILFAFYGNNLGFYSGALLGLLIYTSLGTNLAIDYFQAQLRVHSIALPISVVNVCSVLVLYWFSLSHISPLALILVLPISEAISAIILLALLRHETNFAFSISIDDVLKLLRHSAPIAVTTILVIAYTRLDVIFLNQLADSTAVGYYSIAYRITEPFQLVAVTFSISIYSHLSQLFILQPLLFRRKAIQYVLVMLGYGLVSCMLLIFVAPYLIEIFLPKYIAASPIMYVLAVALVVRGVNTSLTAVIQALGQYSSITIVALVNMILISLLLWLLLTEYGAIGAAFALLIGEIINTTIQLILFSKINSLPK